VVHEVHTAVVLAGGAGLRLRPLTDDRPKAMIMVAGKPLLEWILEALKRSGIHDIVIGVAYKKERIMEHFGDGQRFGFRIKYSDHTVEGGTGEGFRLAIERHVNDPVFLAMNGDELVDVDINEFTAFHAARGGIVTMAVGPLRSPYGVVQLRGDDVIGFQEKPILHTHYVSVGAYVMSHAIVEYLPKTGDIERLTFPQLASARKLKAYVHKGFWATLNTAKDLEDVENQLGQKR